MGPLKSLYRDIEVAVTERGWKMPQGAIWFGIRFLFVSYLLQLLANILPSKLSPFFHRLRGVKVGRDVYIHRTVIIDEAYPENITIEDEVRVAAGTVIISHMKAGQHLRTHYLPFRAAKVKLCKYSFIGANAVIMPGVTVGEGAVVTSGSVLMSNAPAYTVVSGNPAKKIKELKRIG